MTADDQHFLDLLHTVSKDVQKFATEVVESTDKHIEHVYSAVKDTLASTPWIPESARPAPPQPPPTIARTPSGIYRQVQDWMSRHRAISAALIAFIGTGAFMVLYQKKSRKRRAKRAKNGARTEVVVIAGTPTSPITKSLSLDLERRGFIVYIITNSEEEEQMVMNESRNDIRPLPLMIANPTVTNEAVSRFNDVLGRAHQAFPGATSHHLHFAGLIVVPDQVYAQGPIEVISPDLWADALNAKILGTIATTQAFLPAIIEAKGRILVLTPNIIPSLKPAFHGVESTVVGALEGFTRTLQNELGTVGINVCHIKMGTFDTQDRRRMRPQHANALLGWPESKRNMYGPNYVNHAHPDGVLVRNASRGSHMRVLHNSVFDALTQSSPRPLWRVGRGSLTYDMIGNWIPGGLVGWMMGIRNARVEEITIDEPITQHDQQHQQQYGEGSQSWERVEG